MLTNRRVRLVPKLRAYRSASATTSTAGAYSVIGWDAESPLVTKRLITHSNASNNDRLVIESPATYQVRGVVTFTAAALLTGVRARITIDGVADGAAGADISLSIGAKFSVPIQGFYDLTAGQIVRVEVASFGIGSVSLTVGDGFTWVGIARVG